MVTVILGAGIIGTSTAFYLSQPKSPPREIHLVEASPELFASASGYAAGFVARDWFCPALANLGELSFDLHKSLAEDNNGYERWGYSASSGTSLAESAVAADGSDWLREGASRSVAAARTANGGGNGPTWLKRHSELDVMSDGRTTAQIDPLRLCRYLMETCQSRGVQLHQPARATSLARSSSGSLSSVTILNTSTRETKQVACNHLVIAAGAWSPQVYKDLYPKSRTRIPITSLAGHSLVLQSLHWPPLRPTSTVLSPSALPHPNPYKRSLKLETSSDSPSTTLESGSNQSTSELTATRQDCHAVFTTDAEGEYSPELFSRMPDGHIYLAGLNSPTYPLPKVANERIIDRESIAILKRTAHRLLEDEFNIVREGVCWRPVAKRGVPIIAPVPGRDNEGIILCAGHGAWGISNSLGSGYCVAEIVKGNDMSHYVQQLGF